MRARPLLSFVLLGIILAASGCDNVDFEGVRIELRAPASAEEEAEPAGAAAAGDLSPLRLAPVVYLVERTQGSRAAAVPVASLGPAGYEPLPDPAQTPDLLERFPIGRWQAGAELVLLAQGVRAGTFVVESVAEVDSSTCQPRPRALGSLELAPGAADQRLFLAMEKDGAAAGVLPAAFPGLAEDAALRNGAFSIAARVFPELGLPVPPSIAGVRRDLQPLSLGGGRVGLVASHVIDDQLATGEPPAGAYGVFVLAERMQGGRYDPVVTWYQRGVEDGKAFPRLLGAHALRGTETPDLVMEIFGERDRWFGVLGRGPAGWTLLYQDACGIPVSGGAIRSFE